MSARAYFMKRVKNCKDVSIISPQAEQWRWPSLFCNFLILLSTTVCSQNINKQSVNIAHETLTDYSFLSRYHNTKSKNYLKRRYRIRHWISMFIGTPCTIFFYMISFYLLLLAILPFSSSCYLAIYLLLLTILPSSFTWYLAIYLCQPLTLRSLSPSV